MFEDCNHWSYLHQRCGLPGRGNCYGCSSNTYRPQFAFTKLPNFDEKPKSNFVWPPNIKSEKDAKEQFKNCGIEVGDYVIVRKAPPKDMINEVSTFHSVEIFWNTEMNDWVDHKCKVEKLDQTAFLLKREGDHDRWWFPFFVCEKVS
jgi:hypothetical protein